MSKLFESILQESEHNDEHIRQLKRFASDIPHKWIIPQARLHYNYCVDFKDPDTEKRYRLSVACDASGLSIPRAKLAGPSLDGKCFDLYLFEDPGDTLRYVRFASLDDVNEALDEIFNEPEEREAHFCSTPALERERDD
jgi:hypothetical protein